MQQQPQEPHFVSRVLARVHPIVLLGIFVVLFFSACAFVQKLDNIGSGWEAAVKANLTRHVNPVPEFCTPTQPFFYYDLGGTMCACKREWSRSEYWAKTFTGFAFDFPHVFTPFQIYIVYQRWTWVLIYILFNEVFEEFGLAMTGYWGFTYDPPYDLEPRYDTFTRDVMLCGIPGLLLGIQFVRTFKVPPYLQFPLAESWSATGLYSKRHHCKVFFQMLVLKQIPLVYNTDFGKYTFYPQNCILAGLYVLVHTVNYFWNRCDWPLWMQRRVFIFHFAWAATSIYMVLYCIYPVLEEAYLVVISMASSSLVFSFIQVVNLCLGSDDSTLGTEMNHMESKSLLNMNEGTTCQDDDTDDNDLDVAATGVLSTNDVINIGIRLQQNGYDAVPVEQVITQLMDACKDRQESQRSSHLPPVFKYVSLASNIMWIVLMMIVIGICISEPLVWDGIMYRRHWCGLVIEEGGNGCIEVGGGLKG